MSEIKMLPLPKPTLIGRLNYLPHEMQSYGVAMAEHNVAAKDAEIEALRGEVRDAYAAADSKAGWEWKKRAEQAEARAERLADAINAYKSECDNPAKDYVLRAKRRDEMFALLHGHYQEVDNG